MKGQHKVNTEHSILTTEDEYEPIASGPPKMIERPKSVPKLDLSKI